ncbi:uncharacterized protein LOC118736151 [Rhagoletis pomonella]|uniref:uncharacterized protein LOC118736151 n=1 Tax=Rhagoletis pomonella TaxID=28610 RepID=UPI00177E672C|nr:uncharacterized protein LOC118736151 [Rhagoletis pomonella]
MTTFTNEQFERLMQAVGQVNERPGSFSRCTARYTGERSSAKVEEFIAAIMTFKTVEKISDADAISGMPMVLEGDAAEWWRGVKSKANAFSDEIRMLREAFSPPKPSWRIYVEIFESKQQKNEVSRQRVQGFDDLLKEAREAELYLQERKTHAVNTDDTQKSSGPARCGFCRKKGHSSEMCFKKKNSEAQEAHAAKLAQAQSLRPKFACYGCNALGVTRANCPNCIKTEVAKPNTVSFNSLNATNGQEIPSFNSLNSLSATIGREIPIANIQIFGVPGQAYFDSGTRTSVASANLKRIMDFKGYVFKSVRCEITLADGSTSLERCLSTVCKITIDGRTLDIHFIVLPNAKNNRTLVGADFMEQAGIVLNMGQRYWYFENEPTEHFDFADPLPLELNLVERVKVSDPISKRKQEDEWVKEAVQAKVYMSEFEYYGAEVPNTYSPHSIQDIFRDSIPPNEITPERSYETDGAELTETQKAQLNETLQAHPSIFGASHEPTPYAQHFIDTGNHEPVALPPYRLSFPKLQELKSEIHKMTENDIIEECDSAWSSPVVMVPKRDGSTRVCVDYRRLNAITKPDRYPLPRMDDLLHAAKSTKFMTTLDLQCGYFQIAVAEKDRDKTCLITPFGTYRFKRMPFGLRNAPETFQRLIDRFKTALPNIQILAYLDDNIICSHSFLNHLKDLHIVFEKLEKFKLGVNNAKCRFCCASVKYLGHVLTAEGIKVDPEKTMTIAERRAPRNIKELVSFIQTCSWYRRFIDQYAKIAKPVTDLTKKNAVWQWREPQIEAFNKLKEMLVNPPILKQAEDNVSFMIKTDASAYALGAVLLQGERDQEHPIEYASRLLTPAERNYSTT